MQIKNLIACCVYLVCHLIISGQLGILLYKNQTRDFFELPLELFIATTLRVALSILFLRIYKISASYIFVSVVLALITRIIFHGPYPLAILACWFFILRRYNRL